MNKRDTPGKGTVLDLGKIIWGVCVRIRENNRKQKVERVTCSSTDNIEDGQSH